MGEKVARGSFGGTMEPRADNVPNIRGTITIERSIPAGSHLHLAGWTKNGPDGSKFVSLAISVAEKGFRR